MFAYTKSWSNFSKSTFIESILVGMPVSDILCEESHYGELFVLDGVQRLICLQEYFNNSFRLQGLKLIPSLEGCRYLDLPYSHSSVFHNRSELGLTIIGYDTDAILKFEFFKRVHADAYRFPAQLARNYAFRDLLFFIRELQRSNFHQLAPKQSHDFGFSIETSKATHREVADFDELFLLLCFATLTFHQRIPVHHTRFPVRFDDLLDEAAIYLHNNPADFSPLGETVTKALRVASESLGATMVLTGQSHRDYRDYSSGHIHLDSDTIVDSFIQGLKGRAYDLNNSESQRIGYRSNRSPQNFLKELTP
ncbi:DUF262 domain-containing protein [Pseudomonas syringae]|nr:DUF262 domain-containing protein [Pseudomonas syringae]